MTFAIREETSPREVLLAYTFDWQHPNDDHVVTVYIEDGKVNGVAIDG